MTDASHRHPATHSRLWSAAQLVGLLATVGLLIGLLLRPALALDVLWNILIPLVPASLLVAPAIWRNVCPLATLNLLGHGRVRRWHLASRWLPATGALGIGLLAVLVPARRFVFNSDGGLLALTIATVAVLALGLGLLFELKAGFCNSICPVLPVERLYGQYPLLQLGNARCQPCTLCTPAGCIDLGPSRSIPQSFGDAGRSHRWLATPYGVFAAAFPGFVIGYYRLVDVPLADAAMVYGVVGSWSLASYAAVAALVVTTGLRMPQTMLMLAAAAAGLYYWFAADAVTTAFGIAGSPTTAIRATALGLVVVWLLRAGVTLRRLAPTPPADSSHMAR